ncbi:hypothetical protein EVG20_g7286 [Dentipellis fragilis]|uniref:Glucose receptor Git3 N-terminal domain-containing protein n=1 Tax=Dentipellis fragilis TaxID=205917 RepID=A0A4Y9YE47_9AGAM|nr:hypothetical protein EVG20_g7286 [Dentipellis fragilis]
MSPSIFAKYAPGQSSAIAVVVVCAILATLALSFVLVRLVWVTGAARYGRSESTRHSRMGFFFRTQLGVFVGCLLACNLLTSISGLISINWIAVGGVKEGFNCTSQAVLSEMGNFGSAYFMVVLGIHAFNSLVLRNRHANWINTVLVVGGWVATIVIGVAPAFVSGKAGPLYGATSFNCGFTQRYPVQHLLQHFLPTFLASVLSTVIYSLVFLILRGTLTINGGLRLNLNPESRWLGNSGSFLEYQRFVNSIGRSMLW